MDERAGLPDAPLFPTRTWRRLSRAAMGQHPRSDHRPTLPSVAGRTNPPPRPAHSCAIPLLQARVATSTIALWLGNAGVRSTDAYVHPDITIKEKALACHRTRFRKAGPLPHDGQGPRSSKARN